MQTYDCVVKLCDANGQVCTEVEKFDVTAPEIIVLRALHGNDNVVRVSLKRMDKRPHAEERDRLSMTYGGQIVHDLFGANHVDLPIRLHDEKQAIKRTGKTYNENELSEAVERARKEGQEAALALLSGDKESGDENPNADDGDD